MGLSYLLDTNVLSRLLREPRGATRDHVAAVGEDSVYTSIVAASELRFGAAKRNSQRLTEMVEDLLAALPVLPLDAPADARYAETRTHLEREGTPIGPNDLLIAAHALALDMVLVTENANEFRRVPHLSVENWMG